MTMPSRDFLVRQAVLNAVPICWPSTTATRGVAGALKDMGCHLDAIFVAAQLLPHINAEFAKLSQRFSDYPDLQFYNGMDAQ